MTAKVPNGRTITPHEIYRLVDLAELSKLSASTIRYYISIGLVSKAHGATFGSYYDARHLAQLVDIKYLKQRGLTLVEIARAKGTERVHFPIRETREGEGKAAERVFLIGDTVEIRCRPALGKIERTLAKRVVTWARLAAEIYAEELSTDRLRKPRRGA